MFFLLLYNINLKFVGVKPTLEGQPQAEWTDPENKKGEAEMTILILNNI